MVRWSIPLPPFTVLFSRSFTITEIISSPKPESIISMPAPEFIVSLPAPVTNSSLETILVLEITSSPEPVFIFNRSIFLTVEPLKLASSPILGLFILIAFVSELQSAYKVSTPPLPS